MTRGNQRDLSRVRNEKKAANGPKEKQGDFANRTNRDADIMRQKQMQAQAQKAGEKQGDGKKKVDLNAPNTNAGSNVVTNQKKK
uniref:Small EDRK-rich factor-like N-terminal domain-containing protein n=1 Tax=Arcella intermedia TaxID=1963864 RepID=A0A6B2LWX8_9EUKA